MSPDPLANVPDTRPGPDELLDPPAPADNEMLFDAIRSARISAPLEINIILHCAQGYSNREIATRLCIDRNRVNRVIGRFRKAWLASQAP